MHYKTFIWFALSASGQRLFIPYPGHLLWTLLAVKGISIGNEKASAFPHYRSANSLVDCSSTKDVQFFSTSEHYGKAHGSFLDEWIIIMLNVAGLSCNISILPSQFWQIRFKSCWLHSWKCRILVLLQYFTAIISYLLSLLIDKHILLNWNADPNKILFFFFFFTY